MISATVSSRLSPRGIFSSMNRPITSPCSAVLTSSPTITFTPAAGACSRASRAPEISLWSVTAIAPRPCVWAVASSTSTGVAQSHEWSVCMCRSTSISGRAARRSAHRLVRRRRVAAGGQPRIDALELRRPSARRRGPACSHPGSACHQLGSRRQARRARVQAPEEALDEAPREQRREQALGRRSERSRRSARASAQSAALEVLGANGSWTWTKSSSTRAQQFLDRACHVDRQRPMGACASCRRRPAPRRRRSPRGRRCRCPRGAPSGSPRAGPQRAARVAHTLLRAGGGEHQHPVPALERARRRSARRGRSPCVLRLPRVGRHMGDGEWEAHVSLLSRRTNRRTYSSGSPMRRPAAPRRLESPASAAARRSRR